MPKEPQQQHRQPRCTSVERSFADALQASWRDNLRVRSLCDGFGFGREHWIMDLGRERPSSSTDLRVADTNTPPGTNSACTNSSKSLPLRLAALELFFSGTQQLHRTINKPCSKCSACTLAVYRAMISQPDSWHRRRRLRSRERWLRPDPGRGAPGARARRPPH